LVFGVLTLSSCLSKDPYEDVEYPNSSVFSSLNFSENKTNAGIEKAVFTLQNDPDGTIYNDAKLGAIAVDSVIVNLDSLPLGIKVDTVLANFKFTSTYAAWVIYTDTVPNQEKLLTGKDTIDFSRPVIVKNQSADQKNFSFYRVKVNVHKVVPDLYVWNKKFDEITTETIINQYAFLFDNSVYYYLSNTSANNSFASNSVNYDSWQNQSLTNLPLDADLRSIKIFDNKIYLFNNNKIYSSENGSVWSDVNFPINGYETVSLLLSRNGELSGIVKNSGNYYFTSTIDGATWTIGSEIPEGFPVSDFVAVANSGHSGGKALIFGGLHKDGTIATEAWITDDGLRWINFTPLKKFPLPSLGVSIITYDDKLLFFGGTTDSTYVQMSEDEGFSWNRADSAYVKLPTDFTLRTYQSVIVDDQKRIVIIGGKDTLNNTLSDVWTVKKNNIDW
jgi:hypothetical protein